MTEKERYSEDGRRISTPATAKDKIVIGYIGFTTQELKNELGEEFETKIINSIALESPDITTIEQGMSIKAQETSPEVIDFVKKQEEISARKQKEASPKVIDFVKKQKDDDEKAV